MTGAVRAARFDAALVFGGSWMSALTATKAPSFGRSGCPSSAGTRIRIETPACRQRVGGLLAVGVDPADEAVDLSTVGRAVRLPVSVLGIGAVGEVADGDLDLGAGVGELLGVDSRRARRGPRSSSWTRPDSRGRRSPTSCPVPDRDRRRPPAPARPAGGSCRAARSRAAPPAAGRSSAAGSPAPVVDAEEPEPPPEPPPVPPDGAGSAATGAAGAVVPSRAST